MSISFETLALAKRYTNSAVADAIGGVTSIDFRFVESLPWAGDPGVIYCVPSGGSEPDLYDEYYYINGRFERIPGAKIDLTPYATKEWINGEGYYKKPANGIPETDLDDALKASIAKAETALQEHQSLAAYRTAQAQDEIDNTLANIKEIEVSDTEPTDPNVKLWMYQNPGQKIEIPTMEDFRNLKPATDEQVSTAVSDWLEENISGGETIAVDKSLTVEGAAADAKVVGDLKSALSGTLFSGITGGEWQNGVIRPDTGEFADNPSRLRYAGKFGLSTNILAVKTIDKYDFLLYAYDTSNTFLGVLCKDGTFKQTGDSSEFQFLKYKNLNDFQDKTLLFRAILRHSDDPSETIELSDYSKFIFINNQIDLIDNALNDVGINAKAFNLITRNSVLVNVNDQGTRRYGWLFSTLEPGIYSISYGKINANVPEGNVLNYKIISNGVYGDYHPINKKATVIINAGDRLLIYNGDAKKHTVEYAFNNVVLSKGCPRTAYVAKNIETLIYALENANYGDTICVESGLYEVHSTLTVPYGVSVAMSQYTKIIASDDFVGDYVLEYAGDGDFAYNTTNPITGGEDDLMCIVFSGGIIDANGQCGCFTMGKGMHVTIKDMTFLNPTTEGLFVGGKGFCYETIVQNCYARTFISGCAGNIGFRVNTTDNHFTDCITQDMTTAFKIEAGANRFTRCHIWGGRLGYPDAHPMLDNSKGFDVASGNNTFIDCYADSSAIGFNISGSENVLNCCHFFNNYNKYGLDNVTYINLLANGTIFIGCNMQSNSTPNLTKINANGYSYEKIACIEFPI